jgi:hypothetical protein
MKIQQRRFALAMVAILLALFVWFGVFGGPTFKTTPYGLPASPMIAYRITGEEIDAKYFADDPNSLRGFAIVQRQAITDRQLEQDVLDVLNSRLIYGSENILCFEPGIAFRFGQGQGEIDALICLTCRKVYFFRGDQVAYRELNSIGIARIRSLYVRLFPGHSPDGSDEDTRRISAARAQERERREQELHGSTSLPTTGPAL